jgi:hypothetical protein
MKKAKVNALVREREAAALAKGVRIGERAERQRWERLLPLTDRQRWERLLPLTDRVTWLDGPPDKLRTVAVYQNPPLEFSKHHATYEYLQIQFEAVPMALSLTECRSAGFTGSRSALIPVMSWRWCDEKSYALPRNQL